MLTEKIRLFKSFLDDENVLSVEYFREVLCTYRLIFAQHRDARKPIQRYCAQGRLFGFKSPFKKHHPSTFVQENADGLLEQLSFRDTRSMPLSRSSMRRI